MLRGKKYFNPYLEKRKKNIAIECEIQSSHIRGLIEKKICPDIRDPQLEFGGPVECPQGIVTLGYIFCKADIWVDKLND